MRIALALGVWVVFVGGTAAFVGLRDAKKTPASYAAKPAAGVFAVEVTASFAIEPDPFSLEETGAGLVVKVNGVEALRRTDRVTAGVSVKAEPVAAVVVGRNELFLEANPPQSEINRTHAIRVRVLRDGEPVAERTFWSEPGLPVAAAFTLDVAGAAKGDGHDH